MKKNLFIAMCCITVLCAACKKEKPYEKFIGSYNGSALVEGTISYSFGGTSLSNDIKQTLPMAIDLSAGDADNRLVLTYTPEGLNETYTATGTINEDKVTFDPVVVKETIEGKDINLTLNMNGIISGTIFSLNGDFSGNGNISILEQPIPLPFTATGTITANLDKLLEE